MKKLTILAITALALAIWFPSAHAATVNHEAQTLLGIYAGSEEWEVTNLNTNAKDKKEWDITGYEALISYSYMFQALEYDDDTILDLMDFRQHPSRINGFGYRQNTTFEVASSTFDNSEGEETDVETTWLGVNGVGYMGDLGLGGLLAIGDRDHDYADGDSEDQDLMNLDLVAYYYFDPDNRGKATLDTLSIDDDDFDDVTRILKLNWTTVIRDFWFVSPTFGLGFREREWDSGTDDEWSIIVLEISAANFFTPHFTLNYGLDLEAAAGDDEYTSDYSELELFLEPRFWLNPNFLFRARLVLESLYEEEEGIILGTPYKSEDSISNTEILLGADFRF